MTFMKRLYKYQYNEEKMQEKNHDTVKSRKEEKVKRARIKWQGANKTKTRYCIFPGNSAGVVESLL